MPQYVIERTIPGAGEMDGAALRDISQQSNEVLRDLGPPTRLASDMSLDS